MSKFEEETIASFTLLFEKVAELGQMQVRDMLASGAYDQFKATLDEAYDVLVKIEDALDLLGMKLEYHHWRISSAFEEVRPLLLQPRSLSDTVLESFENNMQRLDRKYPGA